AAHPLLGNGEHAERVVVAQIVLGGERKPGQIVEGPAVLRSYPGFVELAPVERDVLIRVPKGPPKTLELERAQLVNADQHFVVRHWFSSSVRLRPRNSAITRPSAPCTVTS